MTKDTQPKLSAGPLSAADLFVNNGLRMTVECAAHIIDRETGVAELLEAAKAVHDFLWKERGQVVGMTDIKLSEALTQAIAKCKGSE